MKHGLPIYQQGTNRLVAAWIDGDKIIRQGKKISWTCCISKEEQRLYILQGEEVAIQAIQERAKCNLDTAKRILNAAKHCTNKQQVELMKAIRSNPELYSIDNV